LVDGGSNTEIVKRKAHELGFSHIGIARAERLEAEAGRLKAWLTNGYQAEMRWLENNVERRIDPEQIVPGAKSIVSAAFNYYTPGAHSDDKSIGKISRYAWGDDYHEVVTPKLLELQRFIDSLQPGTISRSYVDTGPVMEKVWAARAGIGWIGKHSNLITRDMGSWVFLGAIITTMPFEYDDPISDFCGSCTACIDACPTGAIVEPYVVDSNKCIPYLTIECRSAEPPGAEDMNFDGWIFGCDTCQDVCPWNRFAGTSVYPGFAPRHFAAAPPLNDILNLREEEFRDIFRKSPVKRAKLAGLQRNARIVLKQRESNNR